MTLELAEDALQRRAILYDKGGDRHYDTISAWIKATRGSDPDASLLYLAAMLEGGEDPRFIARRMVILASEDVGNADPQALVVAVAAAHAVEHVGLPECALNLAQAAVYLALAPKSNASTEAIGRARAWVREHGAPVPPDPLRSAAYPGAEALGPRPGLRLPARPSRGRVRAGADAARRPRASGSWSSPSTARSARWPSAWSGSAARASGPASGGCARRRRRGGTRPGCAARSSSPAPRSRCASAPAAPRTSRSSPWRGPSSAPVRYSSRTARVWPAGRSNSRKAT